MPSILRGATMPAIPLGSNPVKYFMGLSRQVAQDVFPLAALTGQVMPSHANSTDRLGEWHWEEEKSRMGMEKLGPGAMSQRQAAAGMALNAVNPDVGCSTGRSFCTINALRPLREEANHLRRRWESLACVPWWGLCRTTSVCCRPNALE